MKKTQEAVLAAAGERLLAQLRAAPMAVALLGSSTIRGLNAKQRRSLLIELEAAGKVTQYRVLDPLTRRTKLMVKLAAES